MLRNEFDMIENSKFITIDNRKCKSKKRKNERATQLTNLIKENKYLLKCISKVFIKKALNEGHKFNMDKETDKSLKNLFIQGKINKSETQDFKNIWLKMNDDDIGEFLENIVVLHGPYVCGFEKYDFSVESKVYESLKNNNFDIIFYDSEYSGKYKKEPKIKISGEIEFHECKKNVCNVIPYDINTKLKESMERKLEFMFQVNNMVKKSKILIPTFAYNVLGSQKFLDNKKYNFIHILGIKQLIDSL